MKAPIYRSVGNLLPRFSAGFDSGSGFVVGLSNFLKGKDFKGMGVTPPWETLTDLVNNLPPDVKNRVYTLSTGAESIQADDLEKVHAEEFMKAVAAMYPKGKYPAIIIGTPSGAIAHLAAAMRIPLLPQTFLIPLERPAYIHIDEPKRIMDWGLQPGEVFLKNNPYFKLHHMIDPSQDRLTLEKIAYFRVKMQKIVLDYERFIIENLQEGGTIIVSDCRRTWPVTTISDRFVFQFGAMGGTTEEEYHQGGKRVADYLERYGSHVRKWDAPETDSRAPEAEWGFDQTLMNDIHDIAFRNSFKVKTLKYDEPEFPSPLVADLYRWWYREKNVYTNRLVGEMFIMFDPYLILRTASVPFWLKFNSETSAGMLEKYLSDRAPYDEVFLMLFSHGVHTIGLASAERWEQVLKLAAKHYDFLGVEPSAYPKDIGSMVKYNTDFKKKIASRYDFHLPLTLQMFEDFYNRYDRERQFTME